MRNVMTLCSAAFLVCVSAVLPIEAEILSVTGGVSNVGEPPRFTLPPTDVLDDIVTNDGMEGFNEAQGVVTTVVHAYDGGNIPAGTLVDSHMIFLNSPNNYRRHQNVTWTFDGIILGVMSDLNGNLEAASTFELGNPATNYTIPSDQAAPFENRGLELSDEYSFTADPHELIVSMESSQPGDWIRVVTMPDPSPQIEVMIDIKPGSDPNSINCKNTKGVITVAILTTMEFDALTVDHTTVAFEGAAEAHIDKKTGLPRRHEEDVDGDGYLDLVFHFRKMDTTLTCESSEGGLSGLLFDGETEIVGSDAVRMVPQAKH